MRFVRGRGRGRGLGVVATALLAMQVGGCGGDDGGDGFIEDRVTAGSFVASWDLTTESGFPLSCAEVGGRSVSFLFTDSSGQVYEDLFDCEAFAGETDPLPLDDFSLSVALLDDFDAVLGEATLGPADGVTFATCDFVQRDLCMKELPLIEFVF